MQYFIWLLTTAIIVCLIIGITQNNRQQGINLGIHSAWWLILILWAIPSNVNTFQLKVQTTIWLCVGSLSFAAGYTICFTRGVHHANIYFANKFPRWAAFVEKVMKRGRRLGHKFPELSSLSPNVIKKKNQRLETLVTVVQIVLLVIFIFYYIKYRYLLQEYGLKMSRMIQFELGLLFTNRFESYFFQYVVTALLYLSFFYYLITAIEYRRLKKSFILVAANVFMYAMIGQGRFIFFQLILLIFVLIANSLIKDHSNLKKKMPVIAAVFFVLIAALFGMTLLRMGGSVKNFPSYFGRIMQQVYIYFCGPFKGLQELMSQSRQYYGFVPGQCTFSVIARPVLSAIERLGLASFRDPMAFLQETVAISQYTDFNAMFTYYVNFYLDFSYLGFIFAPFFLGYFYSFCVRCAGKQHIVCKIFAYSNMLNLLIGVLRWEYQTYEILCFYLILGALYFWYVRGCKKA